ncbi:HAMP domain-containing histidine kinase [Polaribacter sp. Z014]|uniref:sensor histidine kinase n=1 Tax=Polaribacter sp. Z014 TaxID=2927126 RepID=UPI00202199F0|nr:HAMP domain-containing sensor histidine kinase [Polaribacter sp. Z014]MCL7762882.1 HAMP domain-containing histidine kinase [Polaribacter sp. Z014]
MGIHITIEDKLKERIKELTCLYKVSSLIRNNNFSDINTLFKEIAASVKEAIRFPEEAFVEIRIEDFVFVEGRKIQDAIFIISAVKAFGKIKGSLTVGYSKQKFSENSFLEEEKLLLHKIATEIGDFLERKQIIEKEEIAKRQIERAGRLTILGEITAGIAHELNTPLANILGFAELLKEQYKDDKVASEDLKKIINSAIYSREVVKKLMFFSCEMPQQMTSVNINLIINEAISLLNPNFKKKNIQCTITFSSDEIYLKVDRIQLTQVIFNLVINAIYFSPVKGKINIDVLENSKKIQIRISDEGEGIQSVNSENIFNPFFTTKPIGDGSGLGLSVVHGIIKSHKGTIIHQPNSPKGTIFVVSFPKS